jgi:hypothetical protein
MQMDQLSNIQFTSKNNKYVVNFERQTTKALDLSPFLEYFPTGAQVEADSEINGVLSVAKDDNIFNVNWVNGGEKEIMFSVKNSDNVEIGTFIINVRMPITAN